MKLLSHNTMTYKSPKQWYLKPIAFMGRCQSKKYYDQFKFGSRGFDLVLSFNEQGELEYKNGIFRYDASDFNKVLTYANSMCITCRLTLDDSDYDNPSNVQNCFETICRNAETDYPNIKFIGGTNLNRRCIYKFKDHKIEVTELYASVTSLFKSSNKFLAKLDDWFPWYYAKTMNKENKLIFDDKDDNSIFYLSVDFIEL